MLVLIHFLIHMRTPWHQLFSYFSGVFSVKIIYHKGQKLCNDSVYPSVFAKMKPNFPTLHASEAVSDGEDAVHVEVMLVCLNLVSKQFLKL